MQKFLFLDFDGVLNGPTNGIEVDKVELLNQIVEATQCTVVISSSWRIIYTEDELRGRLHAAGYKYNFAGFTPNMGCNDHFVAGYKHEVSHRGHEIQRWCMDNQVALNDPDTRIVILDDSSDMNPLMDHLVRTSTYIGLGQYQVDEVIRRLNAS